MLRIGESGAGVFAKFEMGEFPIPLENVVAYMPL
jgi:hypothetical protein